MRGWQIDPNAPFFRPLWVRVALVAFLLGWALFELSTGSPGWAIVFGGAGGYLLWVLFLTDKTPPQS